LIFFDSRSIGKHRLVKFTDQFAVADTDANKLPNQLVKKQPTSQTVTLRGTANNLTVSVITLLAKTMNCWITFAPI